MTKALTHCQICGRAIKTTMGYFSRALTGASDKVELIAHHGYKRPGYGWQTASCFGAKWRPYEVACDALPPAIAACEQYLKEQRAALLDWQKTPPRGIERPRRGNYDLHPQVSVLQPAGFYPECRQDFRPNSYATLYHNRQVAISRNTRGAERARADMRQRLADWRPQ